MGIFFKESLSETEPINVYNNNIVKFCLEFVQVKAIEGAEIKIGNEKPFLIQPDPLGNFYFNFKTIASKILNKNYFEDDIEPNAPYRYVELDQSVFKEIEVEYIIYATGLVDTTLKHTYSFIKAVEQLEDYKVGRRNLINKDIAILSELDSNSNLTYHLTYFEGYPFDVPIFSALDTDVLIKNKDNGHSESFPLQKGVNRLFVSDGSSNFSLETKLPIHLGSNELEMTLGNTTITLFLTKKDSSCGVYLKWFNNYGGWNYFLFKKTLENRAFKSANTIDRDFENLENTRDTSIDTTITSKDVISFYAKGLSYNEKQVLNGISESLKIYRYLRCMFERASLNNWLSETLATRRINLEDANKDIYQLAMSLNKSKRNTMSL
ncbi:hypothetical protein J2Q11_08640 [Tenacibaculum finnmarkense genomovar finnmarkense]|uniref:hypothetical protein n=1 Tax=Tenacibaculum finnmarkense TaxID=2781243 RepID=UPI001EFB3CFA|nr:hypothetical protein [Tenacibaculum finnmarkense]MCG8212936.1 hypothetical protein [Tenacibaculum finnmarkense genomovar finnmarkense]MCG8231193.1 hypothetical protein [Tenacibaculum finnmarkense genomovar finnmarkense]MCG8884592.1 hypothetical protein [Tenacibaculum finnmarkense]MCG8897172.1 hypothetical protein [Tenacibaculum finnmarkense]MCG8903221.1 hypothetical protein [Tenacibaculum finnmarkense]